MTERTFAGMQFFVRLAITLLIWKKVLATTTLPPRFQPEVEGTPTDSPS